jgi:arylsulfatase A-like enzyme
VRALPLLLLAACAGAPRSDLRRVRPNIVLILADDLGYSDVGCTGGEIATPNLDALAAGGMRFTQFYNGARCCPTRASLLTGLYAHQAGVGHMVEDRGRPGYLGRLNDRCATLAEVLGPAGYRTLLSGKWHVGGARPHWPVDRGFDRSYTLIGGGSNYFVLDKGGKLMLDAEPAPAMTSYFTDAFTDAAVKFLDEKGPEPFFLYLAYTAPHWPLHAPEEDIARYRETYRSGWEAIRRARLERQGGGRPHEALPPWEEAKDRELEAHKMAVYAAMVERMDRGVGRVLAKLRDIGARENTLVIFLSDNGASPEEYDRVTPRIPPGPADSFHTCGPAWARVSNTPFRGAKRSTYEGGISTPFIASWPAVIRSGSVDHTPGHVIDLMATFVQITGAEYPGRVLPMEGRSLKAAFEGKPAPERPLFWEHEGNRAVRKGRWKLVSRFKQPWELYDIETDRTETVDLSSREPGRVREMASEWEDWARRCNVLPFDEVVPPKK